MENPGKADRDDDDVSDHLEDEKVEGPFKQKMELLKIDDTDKEQRVRSFVVSQGDPEQASNRYKVNLIL